MNTESFSDSKKYPISATWATGRPLLVSALEATPGIWWSGEIQDESGFSYTLENGAVEVLHDLLHFGHIDGLHWMSESDKRPAQDGTKMGALTREDPAPILYASPLFLQWLKEDVSILGDEVSMLRNLRSVEIEHFGTKLIGIVGWENLSFSFSRVGHTKLEAKLVAMESKDGMLSTPAVLVWVGQLWGNPIA